MIALLITFVVAVVIVIGIFIAIDLFAGAGGDPRLWNLLKGLVVLIAVVAVLQRSGVV